MEQRELDLIAEYSEEDEELKRLWENHQMFEKQLERYENKHFLTPSEEMEVKDIKKKKLAGKTRLHALLEKYKAREGK
ncbi:DUF465 domain-containing protein [Desulfonatronospira sp.]|uniref:DUF465 domain-containing protein n=1 Tax=Desulfonatronospira sp. TaxID=1962951 RepID=UPI0025C5D026|nr:DUF465 domain-containing protein [Desulfonatronospira sp.]